MLNMISYVQTQRTTPLVFIKGPKYIVCYSRPENGLACPYAFDKLIWSELQLVYSWSFKHTSDVSPQHPPAIFLGNADSNCSIPFLVRYMIFHMDHEQIIHSKEMMSISVSSKELVLIRSFEKKDSINLILNSAYECSTAYIQR